MPTPMGPAERDPDDPDNWDEWYLDDEELYGSAQQSSWSTPLRVVAALLLLGVVALLIFG